MSNECWIKWEPIVGLSPKYYIDLVIETPQDFKITLYESLENKRQVHVTFKNGVDAYKKIHERNISGTLYELDTCYGKDFYSKWVFFKINNSQYIEKIAEEGGIIDCDARPFHFVFLSEESMVDVIADYEPTVEFVDVP